MVLSACLVRVKQPVPLMSKNKLSRRGFLKSAATAAAGVITFPYIVPSSALGKADAVAASSRITLGFVGVGDHGTRVNLKNFLGNPDTQVIAVCDVDSSHREQARQMVNEKYANQDCAAYNDFRELTGRDDIDAVIVSTPDHWHVPVSIAAVRAGKDVYCEKPLSVTVAEGQALSDAVGRYGRIFQTGSEFRGAYNFHRAAELVRNGRIGKLHTIRVYLPMNPDFPGDPTPMPVPKELDYDMWLGPAPFTPYTKDRVHFNYRWILDYSGGLICDWGAHLVDQAQWANETEYSGPVEIQGAGKYLSEGLYDTAVKFNVEYKYANGVTLVCSDKYPWLGGSIRYEGCEGMIFARYSGYHGRDITAEPASILKSVIGVDEIHLYTCSGGPERNFLDCVRTRKLCYYPAEIGHRSVTVCHLGNIAMLLGRKLRWDPDKERFDNDRQANRMLSRAMRSPWHL